MTTTTATPRRRAYRQGGIDARRPLPVAAPDAYGYTLEQQRAYLVGYARVRQAHTSIVTYWSETLQRRVTAPE